MVKRGGGGGENKLKDFFDRQHICSEKRKVREGLGKSIDFLKAPSGPI